MIWIVEEVCWAKGYFRTNVFANELDALRFGGKVMCRLLEGIGMHHKLHAQYPQYVSISQLVQTDSQRSLLAAFMEYDMLNGVIPATEFTHVMVSAKGVIGAVSAMTPVMAVPTPKTFTALKEMEQKISKVEKPCKFCSTKIFEDEEYCWKCGVKDPGK